MARVTQQSASDADIQETQFSRAEEEPTLPHTEPTAPGGDASPQTAPPATGSSRAIAPDLLRGLLMMLQAIDHSALGLGAWRHGVALTTEGDGVAAEEWNTPRAWAARMLTHLCAPGFMFLMGMGVVYFGRSRAKLGWGAGRMARHFAVRGAVLLVVSEALTAMTDLFFRLPLLMVNMVLVALAVNYVLAGLLWMAIEELERVAAEAILSVAGPADDDDAALEPLLPGDADEPGAASERAKRRASSLAWHAANCVLLALAAVTLWWNHWLSPSGGSCSVAPERASPGALRVALFDFWFYPVSNSFVESAFPPLAWLSCVVLGVLYGRVVTAVRWTRSNMVLLNLVAAADLLLLFALTRLLHFGNLSEGCLRVPEALAHPQANQYLTSFRAFVYVVKYPPSVAFVALTMGVNFLLLALFTALAGCSAYIPLLPTFGRSALFFFAVHFPLYSLIGAAVVALWGHDMGYSNPITGQPVRGVGDGGLFWATWAFGIVLLYYMCRWFSRVKQTKCPDSVWRFF